MPQIYISVGTNCNRDYHIKMAVAALTEAFGALTLSSVYESDAVGFKGDPFYNMVIGAQTELPIHQCVALFKAIEDNYGRVRGGEKFSRRTLDLDLLTYDDQVCQSPVELPRAEILYNAFVLWPLAEIAPDLSHPIAGQSYAQLWAQYQSEQRIWPVPFHF
ncbi:MAG: 2-amino-4-hydroxy-6-hydroxymethyldihydropteridine diphosphokinase [Rheinheimera sp.]|nr:2-amino-4-hydroxy-6-hydroxymethyldihydropteridine diphosphokinase [Rheinheimera sp.]